MPPIRAAGALISDVLPHEMIASDDPVPNDDRRVLTFCPGCQLRLTILREDDGARYQYDIAEWLRLCRHPTCDSPLRCPNMQPLVKNWSP
jgi:hypothetical protein